MAVVITGWLLATAGPTRADDRARFDRHSVKERAGTRPPGVPSSYLATRNGFFHPSCVVRLRSDESIDNDGVIRDLAGSVRERLAPCAYPRFDRIGRTMETTVSAPSSVPSTPPPHGWDGWLTSYRFEGRIDPGPSIKVTTDWLVPEPPATAMKQDIAFFNSIDTSKGDIIQPVLEYFAPDHRWWVMSEFCCTPMDVQTDNVDVNVGDLIRGVLEGTGCSGGVCQNWTITATDVTTGRSTVLRRTGLPRIGEIDPAVLESYDLKTCALLPANGQTTFFNHHVTDVMGKELLFNYRLRIVPYDTAAEVPGDCGWGGSSAAVDRYTLTYGLMPVEIDGGILPDSGSPVTDAGGADAGRPAPITDAARDTAIADAAPVPGDAAGARDAVGTGGASGSAGAATGTGGAPATPDAGIGPPHRGDDGCGCHMTAATDGSGLGLLAALLGCRRRRSRPRDQDDDVR